MSPALAMRLTIMLLLCLLPVALAQSYPFRPPRHLPHLSRSVPDTADMRDLLADIELLLRLGTPEMIGCDKEEAMVTALDDCRTRCLVPGEETLRTPPPNTQPQQTPDTMPAQADETSTASPMVTPEPPGDCCCVVDFSKPDPFFIGIPGGCAASQVLSDDLEFASVNFSSTPTLEGGLRSDTCVQAYEHSGCTCRQMWSMPREQFEREGGNRPRPPDPTADPMSPPSNSPVTPAASPTVGPADDGTCLEEAYLRTTGYSEEHFVHEGGLIADMLCPLEPHLPCGTEFHKLRIAGVDLSYGALCSRVACQRRRGLVNAVWSHVWHERQEGRTTITMFDTRYPEIAQRGLHAAMRTYRRWQR